MLRFAKYAWATPATAFGLCLVMLATTSGGHLRLRDGVLEAWGGLLDSLLRGNRLYRGGAAMTLGHVILARDEGSLEKSRPHERIHVEQFERWGPLLLPVYLAIAGWLRLRGYDPYLDHPFEQAAYQHAKE